MYGKTDVYEKINSVYKIALNSNEEASKFYKLIKALFILETEFPNRYKFVSRISENGGLEFLYGSKVIGYENLSNFIKEEFINNKTKNEEENERVVKLSNKLEELKLIQKDKEAEYHIRQKQVSMYLECKKSFFGRIRYYLKSNKDNKLSKKTRNIETDNNVDNEEEKVEPIYDSVKEYYTIEDLINITKLLERVSSEIKSTELDINAIEISIDRLTKKINNAKQYIEEIEEHKKSIFEFWKFVNKDNVLALNEPEGEEEPEHNKIERKFDYEDDYEEIGKRFDKQNREKLSKEECDSLFITSTEILENINELKNEENADFTSTIEELKKEALENEILFSSEEFDIFGGITEDKTKINSIGNSKHREIKKSKFRILEINKNTKNKEFKENLREIIKYLDSAIAKSKVGMNLNVFYASDTPLNTQNYIQTFINPKNALEEVKKYDKINLYNIKLNEDVNAAFLTNIAYYDNTNRTLPLGMDISDKVILDMRNQKMELKKQKLFRINQEINEMEVRTKILCVYEYEILPVTAI